MPNALKDALRSHTGSIPDILLMENLGYCDYTYTIVEIKHCKDTDLEPQRERAMQQHEALLDLFEQHHPGCKVSILPLLLGVTEVIFKETVLALGRDLRITGPRLVTLAKKLHFSATNNLLKIWKQRQALMASAKSSIVQANWSNKKKRAYSNSEPEHRKKQRIR
jgi:hypothetical protein